jgi:hypothetical protein
MRIAELHDALCAAIIDAGAVTADSLLSAQYAGKRADAVFLDDRVIIEVKSLCKDRVESEDVRTKVDRIFIDWMGKGGPVIFGQVTVGLAQLPQKMADEIVATFGDRVRTSIKDANRQIRATAEQLGWTSYTGLVAVITPNSFKTDAGVIGSAAWQLLRRPKEAPCVQQFLTVAVPVEDGPSTGGDLMFMPHPRHADVPFPDELGIRIAQAFAMRLAGISEPALVERREMPAEEFMRRFMAPEGR